MRAAWGVGGLVAGFGLGFGVSPRVPSQPSQDGLVARAPAAAPRVVTRTADCPEAAVVVELAACEKQREDLELAMYGEPLAWPEDTPPAETEAGFRAALGEVLDDCSTSASLAALDCGEPPCMAVLWDSDVSFSDCEPWRERYGIATSKYSGEVDCGDGRSERIVILSPPGLKVDSVEEMMALSQQEDEDPVDKENRSKRMQARWESLRLDTPCPAR